MTHMHSVQVQSKQGTYYSGCNWNPLVEGLYELWLERVLLLDMS